MLLAALFEVSDMRRCLLVQVLPEVTLLDIVCISPLHELEAASAWCC